MTLTPKGQIDREGRVSFGDASLDVWEGTMPPLSGLDAHKKRDAWEAAFKRHVFARIIQQLNRIGWTVQKPPINPHDVKHYGGLVARWATERHRDCSKGDLKGELRISGRTIEFNMWQGVNTPTRPDHGGRYESDKEGCMPYLLRLEMERTRRRIRDYLCNVFSGYKFDSKRRSIYRKPLQFTAMELIEQSYAKSCHFKGDMADYLKRNGYTELPSYNCASRDGQRIQHGQRVWFKDYDGRICEGIAYYNINNMWWVLMPGGVVANEACHRLHANKPADLKGRHFSPAYRIKRLDRLKGNAARDERFEDAARYRDALARIRATSAGAKA
jgi:hypothetical protein